MKKIFAILLSVVVVIVNAQFGLQISIYEVFKPSIIEEFCVNKDKADSECEARCHMNKIANDDSEQDQQPTDSGSEFKIKLIESDFRDRTFIIPELYATFVNRSYALGVFHLLQAELTTPELPPRA